MSLGPADTGHGEGTSPRPQTAGTLVPTHLGKAPSGQDGPANPQGPLGQRGVRPESLWVG